MGKGNRNRDLRTVEYVNAPVKKKKAPKAKKPMPEWLKRTISIAVVVVLVVGIVAGILASNGTFKRWQVLVKSQTGEFTVNRQVATFLAWELEYYYAYMSWYSSYYQDPTNSLFKTYPDPDSYAFDHATACVRDDLYDSNGNVISTPRDVIDDAMSLYLDAFFASFSAFFAAFSFSFLRVSRAISARSVPSFPTRRPSRFSLTTLLFREPVRRLPRRRLISGIPSVMRFQDSLRPSSVTTMRSAL